MHGGLRRLQHPHHGLRLAVDRPYPGQPGHLGVDVQEPGDPAGRRCVHHHRVIGPPSVRALAAGGLAGLAGQQHVPDAGGDGGREVDEPDLLQRLPGPAELVEHVEVLEQGLLGVDGERVQLTAHRAARRATCRAARRAARRQAQLGRGDRGDPALLVGECRYAEQLRDALTALHLDQQGPASLRGERQCQRRGHGGLPGPALAADHVQPYALPVGIAPGRLAGGACHAPSPSVSEGRHHAGALPRG